MARTSAAMGETLDSRGDIVMLSETFSGYGVYILASYGLVGGMMAMALFIARKKRRNTESRLSKWFQREKN